MPKIEVFRVNNGWAGFPRWRERGVFIACIPVTLRWGWLYAVCICAGLTVQAQSASNGSPPVTTPAALRVEANSAPRAIGIAAPSGSSYTAAPLRIVVTALPNNGTVYFADGLRRVNLRQNLTIAELRGLKFAPAPGASAQAAEFTYTVSDAAGLSAVGSTRLVVNENLGHIRRVGPGQQYSTIAAAIGASQNGDTILVQAGTYTNDFAIINTDITLQSVGGRVNMLATEQISNGKAIFVTKGNDTINSFSFSGARVQNTNGAGIRYEAGDLVLNDDYFHHNEEGLLSAPSPSGTITINNSEFGNNGSGDGQTHNIYVGDIARLTISDSYFHDAIVGHQIKSRARETIIESSRIFDGPTGTGSYSIDLPNGGKAMIERNVIQQGPSSENPIIVTTGEEGGVYADTSLQVSGNTIVNHLQAPSALAVRNATAATAQITGNSFFGLTEKQIASGLHMLSNNELLRAEPKLITGHPWRQ